MTTKPKIKKRTLGDYFDYFSSNAPKAKPEIKIPKISVKEFITRLQSSGVEFHISPGFFETGGRALTNDERENLREQSGAVLCHLQQAALKHFIFDKFPDFLEQFEFEVNERVGIISETDQPDESAQFAAARQTAHLWFHDYFIDGVFEQKGI